MYDGIRALGVYTIDRAFAEAGVPCETGIEGNPCVIKEIKEDYHTLHSQIEGLNPQIKKPLRMNTGRFHRERGPKLK